MNWFILILVFHVLKLSVCIASNQVCPVGQFLNASGVCVNCTVCKESEKGVTIRPCSSRADALCGTVSDLKVNLPSMKKPKNQLDFAYKFLDLNAVADLSKDNITTFLNKYSKTPSPPKSADKLLKDDNYYDYLEEDDDDDDDYDGEEISSSSNIIETSNVKSSTKNLGKPVKKSKNKSSKDFASSKDSFLELSLEPSKNGKQIKKDLNINTLDTVNKTAKPVKYSVSKYPVVDEEVTVIDPDSLKKKFVKDTKKSKSKKKDQVEVNDHSLKIANTKFVIDINDDDKSDDDGRWLRLSHPHIVDQKIYVDLANDNPSKDKKASTFFSSSEKLENQHRDQEYANEMTKLLNETSSILNTTTNILNQTIANKLIPNDETFDNTLTKNLDDEDDDDEDEDDEDEDEDDDDDDDDKDDDDDEDEDDDDNDDYNFIYNDVLGRNATNKLPQNVEKVDADMDDEYDLLENDNLEDKKWYPATNDVNPDIIAEPFVSTANWQILVLVSAMSACLLFFIVVSTYVCIYMRKRRQFKTNFEADVEDLSVRVNLMQHAGFEADDTSNIKNYITQLRGVKLNNEKVPKLCTRNK